MGWRFAIASSLAAAWVAGASAPAEAQCRLCSTPTTQVATSTPDSDVRLEVDTSLDFSRLVLLGAGDGAATLLPDGNRSATGSVATVSASAMVGSVTVHGEPGRTLRIEMPRRIDLFSVSGGAIAIDQVETDLPALPQLDSAGNLTFRFGGRLKITGDSEGDYRGDLRITAEYL